MGSWEKLALSWLGEDLARVSLGADVVVELGPAEGASQGRAQALRVDLPNFTRTSTPFPVDGSDPNYFYSTRGDNLDNTIERAVSLTAATPISFRASWDIEKDWDYAYLEAQLGGVWQPVQTSVSSTTNPNEQNFGFGITGASKGWKTVTATLPAGASGYRFRYWTDGFVVRPGLAVDSINLGGVVDNATSTAGWTLAGFQQLSGGLYTESFFHDYLAESRNYVRNDTSLCGAYQFLYGNWLEKQCYADGLLIHYRNSSVGDNNTAAHPGTGMVLPVDAHPAAAKAPDDRTLLPRGGNRGTRRSASTRTRSLSRRCSTATARSARPTRQRQCRSSSTPRPRLTTTRRRRTTRSGPRARASRSRSPA